MTGMSRISKGTGTTVDSNADAAATPKYKYRDRITRERIWEAFINMCSCVMFRFPDSFLFCPEKPVHLSRPGFNRRFSGRLTIGIFGRRLFHGWFLRLIGRFFDRWLRRRRRRFRRILRLLYRRLFGPVRRLLDRRFVLEFDLICRIVFYFPRNHFECFTYSSEFYGFSASIRDRRLDISSKLNLL